MALGVVWGQSSQLWLSGWGQSSGSVLHVDILGGKSSQEQQELDKSYSYAIILR